MVITATIPLLEHVAREHDRTAVFLWFSGHLSLYRISIMGALSRYYHLFNQNFTGWCDTARRLLGWSDGEYNCQYWQRLERNWRRWKHVKPAGEVKGRLTAVCEVVEEEGGKIEE